MWYVCNRFLKRLLDIILSSMALIAFMPVWLMIAIAIKCDSKGPILFVQERRTKNGQLFKMYKFRSMVVGAERMGARLCNYENDPRVTKTGRFLRSSSLDELPQLWNVIKGELSLVGPRPCVSYELGDFDSLNQKYKKRFAVRGGITGLAQIQGRNKNSWDEKVTYDNMYIDAFRKQGVWLDMKIMAGTAAKVFKKQDIYDVKSDASMEDAEAAKVTEEEIIRIAHLPDEDVTEQAAAAKGENRV